MKYSVRKMAKQLKEQYDLTDYESLMLSISSDQEDTIRCLLHGIKEELELIGGCIHNLQK